MTGTTKIGFGYTYLVRNNVGLESIVGLGGGMTGGSEWAERSVSERVEPVGVSAAIWGWELSGGIGSETDAVFRSRL